MASGAGIGCHEELAALEQLAPLASGLPGAGCKGFELGGVDALETAGVGPVSGTGLSGAPQWGTATLIEMSFRAGSMDQHAAD